MARQIQFCRRVTTADSGISGVTHPAHVPGQVRPRRLRTIQRVKLGPRTRGRGFALPPALCPCHSTFQMDPGSKLQVTFQVSPAAAPSADHSKSETGGASPDERANGAGSFPARRQRPGNRSQDGNAALKVRFSPGGGRFQKNPEIKNPGLRRFTSAGQAARPPFQAGMPGLLSLQKRETRNQELISIEVSGQPGPRRRRTIQRVKLGGLAPWLQHLDCGL